jgi:cytochrome c556
MKKAYIFLALIAMVACRPNLQPQLDKLEKENKLLKEIAGPLPASMDKYFPPKADAPVFLLEMFALSSSFEGIGTNLQEKDINGAKTSFKAFKAQFLKVSAMVEEWKDKFPVQPLDTLEQALIAGDNAKIGNAMGRVGQVCANCHLINMVKAQQKYHWPGYEEIKLTDSVSKASLLWPEYMIRMAGTYNSIGVDMKEGKASNARSDFQAFSSLFTGLADGCENCHETPRTYFVDARVTGMIRELGKAVNAATPDTAAIGKLSADIGMESCLQCHLVHIPSAHAKARWRKYAELFKQS